MSVPHISRRQPKRWMIVPQIICIPLLQSPIPLSPLPLPILPLNQHIQRRTTRATNPQHAQTNAIPRAIRGRLSPQKNITRDNATDISKANLHRTRHTALIMSRHEIAHPRQHHGLRNVSAGYDEEEREVLYASRQMVLGEQHDVADGCDNEAGDAEPVSVAQAVGQVGCDDGGACGDDEDGDGADLSDGRGVAEFFDDGGDEEGACVAGVDDALDCVSF
jgi:hypothetical protein